MFGATAPEVESTAGFLSHLNYRFLGIEAWRYAASLLILVVASSRGR